MHASERVCVGVRNARRVKWRVRVRVGGLEGERVILGLSLSEP